MALDNNKNNNKNNNNNNNNNIELDSRLPLAAYGPERDDKAIYNLVTLLPKRGIYIRVCISISFCLIFPTGSGCQYQDDSQAFLFSLVNKPGWAPVKLPQTGQYSYHIFHSIYDCSSYGPTFGGHDIYIADNASSSSSSHTNLGVTYSPPSGYNRGDTFALTFLAGGSNYHFTPDEIETFYETT